MGSSLKNIFMRSRRGVILNVFAGVSGAVLLQSSTAVALLVSGFAATGVMGVTGSLAVVLGADFGTAIVVQFLSLNLTALIPVFLAIGGILFLKFEKRTVKQIGRILIGIAFILLSLKMIGEATTPMRESAFLPAVVQYLGEDAFTAFLGGALLTFIFHSSVAAILLFATFCALGVLPVAAGISLVLGANVGGGLIAVWLTRNSHIKARRITIGNLIVRATGAIIVLIALQFYSLPYDVLGVNAERQLVNFHFIFNAGLVLAFLPLIVPLAKLSKQLIGENGPVATDFKPASALKRDTLDNPSLALACATRELLRMSEQIEVMFAPVMDFFVVRNPAEAERIRKMDEEINLHHTDIKLFIAELNQRELTAEQAQRGMELINITISLEHVGDLISRDMLKVASSIHDKELSFSEEGWNELTSLHNRVSTNIQLALNVLISDDLESARQLIREKEIVRNLEKQSHDKHLNRLSSGARDSITTSDIHLETIRILKEINSRFVTFAYPVLANCGELLDSRLAEGETAPQRGVL
jgi:phosphate:Na+ symporter